MYTDQKDDKWIVRCLDSQGYDIYYGYMLIATLSPSMTSIQVGSLNKIELELIRRFNITSLTINYIDGTDFKMLYDMLSTKCNLVSLTLNFSFSNLYYWRITTLVPYALKNNITLTTIRIRDSEFKELETRNQNIQNTIKMSVLTLIAIKKYGRGFQDVPKEIVLMIAKYLFSTRSDIIWLKN